MNARHFIVIPALLIILALLLVPRTMADDGVPPMPTPAVSPTMTPTPAVTAEPTPDATPEPTGLEPLEVPTRLEILSEELGLPLPALRNMSDRAILQLFARNQRKLNVKVYERNENGGYDRVPPADEESRASEATAWDYFLYLPQLLEDPPSPDPNPVTLDMETINRRLYRANIYLEGLYTPAIDAGKGLVHEYIGVPLWIENEDRPTDTTYPRMAGHYGPWGRTHPFGKVDYYVVGESYELMTINFEEATDWNYGSPSVWADRYYGADGTTVHQLQVFSFNSTDHVNLWLGSMKVAEDLSAQTIPFGFSYTSRAGSPQTALPASRYTVKHASRVTRNVYEIYGDISKRDSLDNLLYNYGFTTDIYNPMFGLDSTAADDFVFGVDAYHDCDSYVFGGTSSTLPWGNYTKPFDYYPAEPQYGERKFPYYPYEPKECTLGIQTYITISRLDYLAPILQAIHILNKYDDPDHSYPKADLLGYTTPRQVARWAETTAWNGYGIKVLGKPSQYASAVRSNAFQVLETLLGYKFGDATSAYYADTLAIILLKTQWGSAPFDLYWGATGEDDYVLRPNHFGGQMVAWSAISSSRSSAVNYAYELPPPTALSGIVDLFNMPKEVEGVLPTNAEATATFVQALRVYAYYRYGISTPSYMLIP